MPSEDLVKKLQTYTVTDTMSKGIRYASAEVYLDDKTQLKEKEDYTVEAVDDLNVRFVFAPEKLAGAQEVIIYYNTTLTEDAPLAEDISHEKKNNQFNPSADHYPLRFDCRRCSGRDPVSVSGGKQ